LNNSIWKKVSNWELWPFGIIYAPLSLLWLYYSIKAQAFWYFSNVNPTIEFSGFEGETKEEMYVQLPVELYPKTVHIKARTDIAEVRLHLVKAGFNYPFIVKPERGMQGILVRKVEKEEDLIEYHNNFPLDYLIQDFVDLADGV
jgi:hypothetical protein